MNKTIIKIAKIKAKNLIEKYDGFNNIILDKWRGYRFIFDAEEFLTSKYNGKKYRLSKILKNERNGYFNGGLLRASSFDKKLFGNQKYLNCKTLEQYKNCYLNFINLIDNKKELEEELLLVRSLCIVFSKDTNRFSLEKKFKREILNSNVAKRKFDALL